MIFIVINRGKMLFYIFILFLLQFIIIFLFKIFLKKKEQSKLRDVIWVKPAFKNSNLGEPMIIGWVSSDKS
jgi:hypothetical protein